MTVMLEHDKKSHVRAEVELHVLSISTLDVSNKLASRYGRFTIGTEAPGQVDCLYWVSAIQSADEISPA
jgi:hypothetical protein